MTSYLKSKTRTALTTGSALRIAREMLGYSQNDLAKLCKIPQSTISGIESNKIALGVERAAKFARALHVHPAVLLFPNWDIEKESAA
jgi:transcriptional regulator with XRE-family HTH domain